MKQKPRVLIELVGGPADGKALSVPAYAKTIAIPHGSGSAYQELIYKQDASNPHRFTYGSEA